MKTRTNHRLECALLNITGEITGTWRQQDEWIEDCNSANVIMASAADILDSVRYLDQKSLSILRDHFDTPSIKTSTCMDFYGENQTAVIHYYFGLSRQYSAPPIIVPDYVGESVEEVVQSKEGRIVLSTIFERNNVSSIIKDLERLANKKAKDISMLTPDKEDKILRDFRESKNYTRAVAFFYCQNKFFINTDNTAKGRTLKVV